MRQRTVSPRIGLGSSADDTGRRFGGGRAKAFDMKKKKKPEKSGGNLGVGRRGFQKKVIGWRKERVLGLGDFTVQAS